MAMQSIPHGLIQVTQIKSVGVICLVTYEGMLANKHDIHNNECEHDQPGQSTLNTQRIQATPRLL
jgi:hypothetical protein